MLLGKQATAPNLQPPSPPSDLPQPHTEPNSRQFSPRRFFVNGAVILSCTAVGGILALRGWNFLGSTVSCAGPQAMGRIYIGAINRSQQALYEENHRFAQSLEEFQDRLPSQSQHYRYSIQTTENATFHSVIPRNSKTFWQKLAGEKDLNSLVGAVFIVPGENGEGKTTVTLRCQANQPGIIHPTPPTLQNGTPTCPPNFRNL